MCQIIEFKKASASQARQEGLTIIYELDERRFAIDWNISELNHKPGELISIRRKPLWKRP